MAWFLYAVFFLSLCGFLWTHVLAKNFAYFANFARTSRELASAQDELPRMAVREAIVNAVCHRDYESNGAVQVMLFRDRLEIMNPGTLPRGWTAETLLTTHESIARNKVIAKALDWAGYVERSGHGTEFIIEKYEAQGLATPQYKPDAAIFHTIIWRKTVERAVAQSNGPVAYQVAHQVAYQH